MNISIEKFRVRLNKRQEQRAARDMELYGPGIRGIPLTKGQIALVDEEDYQWLVQRHWYAMWSRNMRSYYAARTDYQFGEQGKILMHRAILEHHGLILPGEEVDHVSHETTNNRKVNLHPGSHRKNMENRSDNTSGFPGVSWSKSHHKWQAQIKVKGVSIHLGYYRTSLQAYTARERYKTKHCIV